MVTHRERVASALHRDSSSSTGPDRLPCGEFFISDGFVREFRGLDAIRPARLSQSHHQAVVEQLDLDAVSVAFSAGWGALEQPDEDRALETLMQWRAQSDRFVFALIDGPFSWAVKARGFNALMHYMRGAPHVARDLFERGAEETRVTAQAVRDAGAEGVVLGEDIAYGKTTYVSPTDLRELYLPALRQAAHGIRALGLEVFFHSDGNLTGILDDLAQCELTGIHGLEPESGMEIGAVRARVGNAMTLWGNLGYELLSALRTEDEIGAALREIESATAGSGGLILGSCTGLVQGLHVETVKRVYASRLHPSLDKRQ